jgi:hypothetical protein
MKKTEGRKSRATVPLRNDGRPMTTENTCIAVSPFRIYYEEGNIAVVEIIHHFDRKPIFINQLEAKKLVV